MDSIRDIFSNRIFRIPDYQRGYSWEKQHLDDFWQDISNLQRGRVHYTGMISVEEVDKAEYSKWKDDKWLIDVRNDKPFFIVDGQQRLTTAIILLWVIIDSLDEDQELSLENKSVLINKYIFTENKSQGFKSYIFGYHKDNPSYEFLKREIFGQAEGVNSKELEETAYTNKLLFAKDYFQRKVRSMSLSEKNTLYDKITKQLMFDFKVLDKELDIFIVFETMNNRGKPLSNLEKLKNRLIYLSTLLDEDNSIKKELRNDINERWKTVYKYLGLNKENKLDDDAFLQNHWVVFYRYERREPEYYANDIFERIFTSHQVITKKVGYKDIKIYIDSIAEAVKQWFVMFNPTHTHALELTESHDILYWLKKQNIVGFKAFQPLIMSALLSKYNDKLKAELIKNTEAYVFLIFNVSARRSNTGTYHFNAKANELYKEEISISELISDLRLWIYGTDEFRGYFDRDNFYSYLKDLFQRDSTSGYADWKYLKYVLYEYELFLNSNVSDNKKEISYPYLHIQSVMPNNPVKQCWRSLTNQYLRREKKYIAGSLGNFMLSRNGKHTVNEPCFNEMKTILSQGLHNEVEVSEYLEWGYDAVVDRGIKILNFIEDRWEVSLGNEQHKKELLFLDFKTPNNENRNQLFIKLD